MKFIIIFFCLALNACDTKCSFIKSYGFALKGDLEYRLEYQIPQSNRSIRKIIRFPEVKKLKMKLFEILKIKKIIF